MKPVAQQPLGVGILHGLPRHHLGPRSQGLTRGGRFRSGQQSWGLPAGLVLLQSTLARPLSPRGLFSTVLQRIPATESHEAGASPED